MTLKKNILLQIDIPKDSEFNVFSTHKNMYADNKITLNGRFGLDWFIFQKTYLNAEHLEQRCVFFSFHSKYVPNIFFLKKYCNFDIKSGSFLLAYKWQSDDIDEWLLSLTAAQITLEGQKFRELNLTQNTSINYYSLCW